MLETFCEPAERLLRMFSMYKKQKTRLNDKKIKNSKGTYIGIEFNSATKSKGTKNKILG